MKINVWLFVSRTGNVRVNKSGGGVKPNEIAMKVALSVPDGFFSRPVPVVEITVPESAVGELSPHAMVEVTAQTVAETLGVSVNDVRDGLNDALARAQS